MGEVRATVRPFDGRKHYGTDIAIRHPSGRQSVITVWIPVGAPSDNELAEWGTNYEGWKSNVEVEGGWGAMEPIQHCLPDDSHYQSRFEEAVARRIAETLDGMEWGDD